MYRLVVPAIDQVVNQVKDCLPRDPARPALSPAARDHRATLLSNKHAHSLISPLVTQGYKDVTEDVTKNTIEDTTDNATKDATDNMTKDGSESIPE